MSLSHEERRNRRKQIADCVVQSGLFEAMKKFSVSRQTVESSCAEHGVKIKEIIGHEDRRKLRENAAKLCKKFSPGSVARQLKVSEANVRMACKEFGVTPIRDKPHANLGVRSFRILKLLLDGVSQSEIARELSVSRQYVEQVRDKGRDAGFVFEGDGS